MFSFLFLLYLISLFITSDSESPTASCSGIDATGSSSSGVMNHLTSETTSLTPFIVIGLVFGVILCLICAASLDCCRTVCECIYNPFWACLKAYSSAEDEESLEAIGTKRLAAIIYLVLSGAMYLGLWQAYRQSGVDQGTWISKEMLVCWKGVNPYCNQCPAPYRPEVVVRYFDEQKNLLTLRTCPELPCKGLISHDDAVKVTSQYTVGKTYSGFVLANNQTIGHLTIHSFTLIKIFGLMFFVLNMAVLMGLCFSYVCGCNISDKKNEDDVEEAFS